MSAQSFDLLTEAWIPVVDVDGTRRLVGILDALAQADRIRRVEADTRWQSVAVLRMLLAIATAARGDTAGYLADRGDRFDLFDAARPFMQIPGLAGPVRLLSSLEVDAKLYPRDGLSHPADVARWLVTVHQYDASGIRPAASGDPRAKDGKSYPVATWLWDKTVYVIHGATLADTLALNAPAGEPGVPVWDRDPDVEWTPRAVTGAADLLVWQGRRVRLLTDLSGLILSNGSPSPAESAEIDPMIAVKEGKPLRLFESLSEQPWRALSAAAAADWPAAAAAPAGSAALVDVEIISPLVDRYGATVHDIAASISRVQLGELAAPERLVHVTAVLEELIGTVRNLDANLQLAAGRGHPAPKEHVSFIFDLAAVARTALADGDADWLADALRVTRARGRWMVEHAGLAAFVGRERDGQLYTTSRAEGWFYAALRRIEAGLPAVKRKRQSARRGSAEAADSRRAERERAETLSRPQ